MGVSVGVSVGVSASQRERKRKREQSAGRRAPDACRVSTPPQHHPIAYLLGQTKKFGKVSRLDGVLAHLDHIPGGRGGTPAAEPSPRVNEQPPTPHFGGFRV